MLLKAIGFSKTPPYIVYMEDLMSGEPHVYPLSAFLAIRIPKHIMDDPVTFYRRDCPLERTPLGMSTKIQTTLKMRLEQRTALKDEFPHILWRAGYAYSQAQGRIMFTQCSEGYWNDVWINDGEVANVRRAELCDASVEDVARGAAMITFKSGMELFIPDNNYGHDGRCLLDDYGVKWRPRQIQKKEEECITRKE